MTDLTQSLIDRLTDNPCRGIVVGMDEQSHLIQLSWIMGRSEHSQNRLYVVDELKVSTAPADASKMKDPSLIIYTAMNSAEGFHVVSNGAQTDAVLAAVSSDYEADAFIRSLRDWEYEPDGASTPRITGMLVDGTNVGYLSVISRGLHGSNRNVFERLLEPGLGYCVTTYRPGSKSLPSFEGEPFPVRLDGDLSKLVESFWHPLEPDCRVAIAAKDCTTGQIELYNRFSKVDG